jgi:uncharacterized protein
MVKNEDEILTQIKKIVWDHDPSAKVYLYGSRSRGTAKNDSDWDLLILLDRDRITFEIENEISYALFDLEFDTGEIISPMIYSEKEWYNKFKITPFFHNVMSEGVLI